MEYDVKDIALFPECKNRIEWAENNMPIYWKTEDYIFTLKLKIMKIEIDKLR